MIFELTGTRSRGLVGMRGAIIAGTTDEARYIDVRYSDNLDVAIALAAPNAFHTKITINLDIHRYR